MQEISFPVASTYSIALGSVIEASLSSSDMCAPASGPMKHQIGLERPTRQDKPVLGQSPPLLLRISGGSWARVTPEHAYWKFVKTSLAGAWSAMIQKVSRNAKKPNTCRNRTTPSASGKC